MSDCISVTQLSNKIKNILLDKFPITLKIKGEISNIKNSGNNIYLTLKDESSSINVVSFHNKFDITNGDNVIVSGKINSYQKQSSYQIIASKIEKTGTGDLFIKYSELKKTCEKKGLFLKKRVLPTEINRIGILTSTEGAALQDILYVLNANLFTGEIYIKNCSVQGTLCSSSVCDGIKYFNELNKTTKFDILLITRGGGSIEDLMGYSTKEVVNSIYDSDIITISAIGHEIDFMLSDFTADIRAPTPSIAGQIISSVQKNNRLVLNKHIENLSKLKTNIINKINTYEDRLSYIKKFTTTFNPDNIINSELLNLEKNRNKLKQKMESRIKIYETKINNLKSKNNENNMKKVLNNGYSVLLDQNGNIISQIENLLNCIHNKQKLKIILSDGEFDVSLLYAKEED
jgi:exodeoxyribonuclease VII large subunit